jgi:cob(I)alamin adenosyltransferase
MKIYTKTGDDGTTGLIGGRRVRKDELRLDVYGTVDELCAAVGWAAAAAVTDNAMKDRLKLVQDDLFVIGSHLATPPDQPPPKNVWLPPVEAGMVARLEEQIDAADAILPALKSFILPGGGESAARLHLARTICRRAERLLVALSTAGPAVDPTIVIYLNRLSDWLFVQARLANHLAGIADVPWMPKK